MFVCFSPPDQYIRTLHLSLSCTIIDSKLYLHMAAVVYSICMDLETVVVFVQSQRKTKKEGCTEYKG